jgi:hypothetical protein
MAADTIKAAAHHNENLIFMIIPSFPRDSGFSPFRLPHEAFYVPPVPL